MDVTRSHGSLYETFGGEAIATWWISVVHHPNVAYLGRRCPVPRTGRLVLGREETAFGPGVLVDSRMSRRHATVELDADSGGVRLSDLKSRNGTFVGRNRVRQTVLADGDVFGLGSLLLLLHRAPAIYEDASHARLIGVSWAIGRVVSEIDKAAAHPTSVLVTGETGTGKELVARELHRRSGRRGTLACVNCGAVGDNLLSSELFGHVRGAFSGADRDRDGLLQAADGGTAFLDEIGDASAALQVSLLRFLQEGEVRKVGSNRTTRVDTRVVAATNRDLHQLSATGGFREDLYARLAGWHIHVPPLRERRVDIPHLALHFARQLAGTERPLHYRLARRLLTYDWPRNVRELEAVIGRAHVESVGKDSLRLSPDVAAALEPPAPSPSRPATVEAAPSDHAPPQRPDADGLRAVVVEHRGNIRRVSQVLGVSRNTLYRWLGEDGIDLEALRQKLRA